MSAAKIKKGDKVVILSGKDKGKHGEVTRVSPKEGKVVVGGINMMTWRFICNITKIKMQIAS